MESKSQFTFSITFLALFAVSYAAIAQDPLKVNANAESTKTKETWAPVTEPKEFKVNVADGIYGSNQIRQEKWDKGTMTGMFSKPVGNNKWEIVTYIADDKGFRITSTKVVDEKELSGIQAGAVTQPNKAQVDIDQDGTKTSYTVTKTQAPPSNQKTTNETPAQ